MTAMHSGRTTKTSLDTIHYFVGPFCGQEAELSKLLKNMRKWHEENCSDRCAKLHLIAKFVGDIGNDRPLQLSALKRCLFDSIFREFCSVLFISNDEFEKADVTIEADRFDHWKVLPGESNSTTGDDGQFSSYDPVRAKIKFVQSADVGPYAVTSGSWENGSQECNCNAICASSDGRSGLFVDGQEPLDICGSTAPEGALVGIALDPEANWDPVQSFWATQNADSLQSGEFVVFPPLEESFL